MSGYLALLASCFIAISSSSFVFDGAKDFSRAKLIRPELHVPSKAKRDVHQGGNEGVRDHLVVKLPISTGEKLTLDLTLNRELLPKNHYLRYQKDGTHVVNRINHQEAKLCHYQGDVRDRPGSWAAISACSPNNSLRGVVYDGKTTYYVEGPPERGHDHSNSSSSRSLNTADHYLYSHDDLISNHTCGYEGTDHIYSHSHSIKPHRTKRSGGGTELIRGPYNADRRSRYVELVLVIDNQMFRSLNSSMDAAYTRSKDIANIINALYTPLDIFIALVGVVVWADVDEISLSTKGDHTLTNFLHYRRERLVKEIPNDNAQLLTKIVFEGGVVGKALKGPICTFEFSGGVSMDHSPVVGLVATTVAHEMGHNFGMEHDSQECRCPDDRCIMAPSSSSTSPTHWSSCSLEYLALAFDHGMDYCLRNKPERLFESPVCGNGFVEVGEQCDCGLKDRCSNPCCNASTCMLYANASCATGECCDLTKCAPKEPGTQCRSAEHECDLPEYCTGESEYCPVDVFKMDGETCDKGTAFCYQGSCRTHTDQCKLLWGPSGKSSDSQCYRMNTKGSRHGNCGYNRLNQSYIKCFDENIYCGMLHCEHMNERLEFGMESVAILSHSFINSGGSIIPCRTAIVDLGLNEVDPGLAPDGAKCAPGKMCVGQRCLPVGSLVKSSACHNNCNNNGVCNSMGHCHCSPGFAPPACRDPGHGGSVDSGPASHPNARREVITAFYIVFLGIVPSVALVSLFIYYIKRNPVFKKKPRNVIVERRPGHPKDRAELLNPASEKLNPAAGQQVSPLQKDLVGNFKGFSITPLDTRAPPAQQQKVPARPAPPAPTQQQRPVISSPVLDDTTSCTVRQMMGGTTPNRPAPPPPSSSTSPAPCSSSATLPRPKPSGGASSLNRIASFIKARESSAPSPQKRKIDRERLRTLEISCPIPQPKQDVEIPMKEVKSGEEQPISAPVVMRVESMREGNKPRNIRSFGSMREGKRPSSLTSTAIRPTVPPPRPPVQQTYDDCLNLLTETNAPLANIDEETSPASPSQRSENIYAVIDETPPSPHYRVPRALDPLTLTNPAASDESMGLLGEIVSEIEARNNDSIYSCSTLKKKKECSPPSEYNTPSEGTDSTYVNTSYRADDCSDSSNSGYLSPIGSKTSEKPLASIPPPPSTNQSYKHSETPAVPNVSFTPFISGAKDKTWTTSENNASPPYKPYSSSLQRNAGPFAAAYNKSPNMKPKETKPLNDMKNTPHFTQAAKTQIHNSVSETSKQHPGLSSVKPDLVSSCTESDVKSPDVLNKNKSPEVLVKPLTKTNSFKPEVRGTRGVDNKISSKPEVKLKKADIKSRTEGGMFGGKAPVTSNVQALQQKFENNKLKTSTVKPIIAAKSVSLDNKVKVGSGKR